MLKMMGLNFQKNRGACWSPRRICQEQNDLSLKKNRKLVSKYLRRVGRNAHLDLSLDSQGFCYIPFKKFLIVVEVPEGEATTVHLHTMVFDLHSIRGARKENIKMTIEGLGCTLFEQAGTNLSLDGDDVILSISTPISSLKCNDMINLMENFMQTAIETNRSLQAVI